ncbi:hypothetical protein AZA_75669 [Nitrospirillum viridazoti Y2]|nr:hypothetical protein AZA_75669 [Nitrospirillum amazonense Y2]
MPLGRGNDAVHHGHGFQRIGAAGRFRRQHDGVGAVIDGGGDVRRLGAGGGGGGHHAVQHLGGDDDRLHRQAAGAHQFLLAAGHLLLRDFHAQVATGHHDGVRQADDVVDLVQGLRLFDLGHQAGAVADQAARLDHVAGLLHEGQGHPVHAQVKAEFQVGAVLGGQRRQVQQGAGQVDALAVGNDAAEEDLGRHGVVAQAGHLDAHAAVIDQQVVARQDGGENLGVRQGDGVAVAVLSLQHEADGVALGHRDLAVLDGADADLGALQVLQDADGPAHFLFQRPDVGVDLGMVLMGAMAEVQAEGVDARQEQRLQHLGRVAGGSDGGDDLGTAVATHCCFRPWWAAPEVKAGWKRCPGASSA